MKNDGIRRKCLKRLFQQPPVGKRKRLGGDFGKTARADDADAVHFILGVPAFMLKTKNLPVDPFARERGRYIVSDLLHPADVRRVVVADLQ